MVYTSSVSPVTMSLAGATDDGSGGLEILVGQQCTASLTGIPDALKNNTLNPPVYHWSRFGRYIPNMESLPRPQYLQHLLTRTLAPRLKDLNGEYWHPTGVLASVTTEPEPDERNSDLHSDFHPSLGQGPPITVTATQMISVIRPIWTATAIWRRYWR